MPILNSQINPHSPAFQENADALRVQVAELKELLTEVVKGGGEVAVARHKGRGKLTARERINALLDEGSPFLELAPLAAYQMYGDEIVPAAGLVAGIGRVGTWWRGRRIS